MVFYGSPFKKAYLITHAPGPVAGWPDLIRDLPGNDRCGGKNLKEGHHVHDHHEGVVGGWGTLWPPGKTMEPQDEEVHFWRAQRDLHHRPPEDAQAVQGSLRVCPHRLIRGERHPVRRHQEAGP